MLRNIIGQTSRLSLTSLPKTCTQSQTRGTCIFRRMYAPIPGKNGRHRGLRKRHYVYILEENTWTKPAGEMEVLLREDAEGVGMKGDIVKVRKRLARYRLLPSNQATYPTPENIAEVQKELQIEGPRPRQSIWAQKTIKYLRNGLLYIPMNAKEEWTLQKSHVRIAFRKKGVELSEDCLDLPEEPVTSAGNITVNVTVNGIEKVPVSATVFYYSQEMEKSLPGLKVT